MACRASDMPPHVRGIVETGEQPRGTNRYVFHNHELLVGEEPDAQDAVLNSCKAGRDALALDRSERRPTPDSQLAGPTNRPRVDAHGLNERSQCTQGGLGAENEVGNAATTRSLEKAEESRHSFVARRSPEDVYARLRSEVSH